MTSAAAASQPGGFDWAALWTALGGLGGAATVATLLFAYLPNFFIPITVTSANYQVGSDKTMTITITVKNRHNGERTLTALTIGQPPGKLKRLKPKWWKGLIGPQRYSINVAAQSIAAGDSKPFTSPLTRVGNTPPEDTLPSNVRVLAYCGAGRPAVKRPRKLAT
jgi:hypothetical protein